MKNHNVLVLMEWYDHRLREGIGRFAAEKGWYLTVDDGCQLPRGWSGDGILTLFNKREDIINYVRDQQMPCVDLGAFRMDIVMPRISGDHFLIGVVAAEHFFERGYRSALYFSIENEYPHQQRGAGFISKFAELAKKRAETLIWQQEKGRASDDWHAQYNWIKSAIKRLPKPLAVFCYCDYDSAKIEQVALDAKFNIPEDIAILGVDNDSLVCENIRVPLSSVRHDLVRVGYEGAKLLETLMSSRRRGKVTHTLIPPRGIELRASTDSIAADDPQVRSVIKFLRENLHRSISVNEAVAVTDLPRHRLEELFAANLGQTIYTTLSMLRMYEVKRLLTMTKMPIMEIAEKTGFCHAQHLGNAFKRMEGCTPLYYRRREVR